MTSTGCWDAAAADMAPVSPAPGVRGSGRKRTEASVFPQRVGGSAGGGPGGADARCRQEVVPMKKILVATDGSPASAAAEAAAVDLCVEHGAELVVVHCWHAPGEWLGQPYYQHAVARELAAARGVFTRPLALAELHDVPVEAELVEGAAVEHILDVAETHGVDLVVMGARGTNPLQRLFVGSVSTAGLRLAAVPVLVVKEGWTARAHHGDRPGMEAASA